MPINKTESRYNKNKGEQIKKKKTKRKMNTQRQK